jgi:hypothetical protein
MSAAQPRWEITWLSELSDLPPEPHPFPSLWHNALTILSGPPNVGKSTLAMVLSRELLLGEPFAGLLPGPGRGGDAERVAYAGLDSGALYEVRNRAEALGIPPERFALFRGAEGARPEDWMAIAQKCKGEGATAIVVDNLVRMCALRGSVNDDHVVGPYLNALNLAGAQLELNVLLIHHASDKFNGGSRELGSTAIAAAARQRIFLRGGRGTTRRLTTEPNDGLPVQMNLAFDFPNFVLLDKHEGRPRNRDMEARRGRVAAYLALPPEDRKSKAVLIHACLANGDVRGAKAIRSDIDRAVAVGLLAVDETGTVIPGPNWGTE